MSPLLSGVATCVVSVAEIAIEPTQTGWDESAQIEIDAAGFCPWVDIALEPGVELGKWKARLARVNGRSGKIGDDRVERRTRDLEGRGALRLHLPEMTTGDHLTLQLSRTWPVGPYPWHAGAQSSRYSELFVDTDAPAPDWVRPDDGSYWVSEPDPDALWAVPHPNGTATAEPIPDPAVVEDVSLVLDLVIPGDPQRSLYPGGGSSFRSTWSFQAAAAGDQGLVVPVPKEAREVQVTGSHTVRDDSVVLLAKAGEPLDHQVTWTQKDAPSYGLRQTFAGEPVKQTVRGDRARIEWEDERTWWVSAVDLKPLLPEQPRLIRALDRRFRRAANPEPAVPSGLRNKQTDLSYVAQLRPALQERTGIGRAEVDPLFPRKLIKARGTRSISTVEASLILWTQLAQDQVPSAWAIVLPAPLGDGFYSSPAGYTEGIVGVQTKDGAVWIDPGCRMCGPFELRPHLEGASMLSTAGRRTPDPTPGRVVVLDDVEDTGAVRRVTLGGPAALIERQRLATFAPDDRKQALVDHWCGDCELAVAEGLGKAGQDIKLGFKVRGPVIDPLDPARFTSEFPDWHDWVGVRSWGRPGTSHEMAGSAGGVAWTRMVTSERVLETLAIEARALSPGLWTTWTEARAAEAVAPDSEEAPEGTEAPDEPTEPTEPAPNEVEP